jgi:prepilin-type processing-associated H-X9-DG protein
MARTYHGTRAPSCRRGIVTRSMRRLTLIRHGLTDWNASGRFQGHSDVPLSTEGRRQAERLRGYVAGLDVDVVVASTLARATETATIAFPEADVAEDDRLRELDFGRFEGRTIEENRASEEWPTWFHDPFDRQTPGGESYRELRTRVVAWYRETIDRHEGAHVVAVSHSGTLQMLLSHLLGVERPRWRKRLYLRHAGVSNVLFMDGEAIIERINDTRHLLPDRCDPFAS